MLEKKIEELTKAVKDLTAAIQQQPTSVPEQTEQAPAPEPETKPEPSSRDDLNQHLQSKVLQMIRDGKTTKPDIKKLIESHGGTLIKDIPDASIDNFKVALDAING